MNKEKEAFSSGVSIGLVVILWLIYASLMLLSPVAGEGDRFQLSFIQIELLRLSILLPMLAVWLLAVYGALRFHRYAKSISDSPDGKAMGQIAKGLSWFVFYIIFLAFIGSFLPYFRQSPLINYLVVSRNIISMITAFIGFYYIFRGSIGLSQIVNNKVVWTIKKMFFLLIPYSLFAMAFTYAFFVNPDISSATNSSAIPIYVLPAPALLFVIVLPYLFMWLLGTLAIINLRNYALTVSGVIYRRVLSRLVKGLIGVIAFTIGLQLFNVLQGTITKLSLGSLLLVVYLLILLIAVSYGSIASGARRLAKIEANT